MLKIIYQLPFTKYESFLLKNVQDIDSTTVMTDKQTDFHNLLPR